ncbi:MAG: hypothetical protein HY094_07960 [Candidatus Melainabacteria bacterium]|nr:hypothetical protein [Candidatus Melainabacteria bacterium]
MFLVLLTLSIRAYIRTLDWKDSSTLFVSALREAPNDLFKSLRLQMLGSLLLSSNSEKYKDKGNEYLISGIEILENSLLKLEEEKQKYQNKIPKVIKAYGLDPKAMQAKTAYLLALTKIGLEGNKEMAFEILKPYMQDLSIIDTQVLDLYLGLLFAKNDLDEAEKTLNYSVKRKLTPVILIPLAILHKSKYNDFQKAENYLKKSFKYFPYDTQTLFNLKQFYKEINHSNQFALFSYLYGIRTHSKESLEDAYNVFIQLNNQVMAKKSKDNIKLVPES